VTTYDLSFEGTMVTLVPSTTCLKTKIYIWPTNVCTICLWLSR